MDSDIQPANDLTADQRRFVERTAVVTRELQQETTAPETVFEYFQLLEEIPLQMFRLQLQEERRRRERVG